MKRFKGKKRKNYYIIYLGVFLISMALTINYLYHHNLIKEDTLISILMNDNFNIQDKELEDIDFILKYAFNIDREKVEAISKEEENKDKVEIENNNQEYLDNIVYIYNTHQEEKYDSSITEPYNIKSGVFIASKMLKEYLYDEGIGAIVEEDNVADALHALNLKYGSSYKISRQFMESAKNEHPSLNYFIDLHRDSSVYDKTTTNIEGENYARVLFVVGLDHDNYEVNLDFATRFREKIDAYNPNLCRGIMKKSGKGVNGIYNQDFSPHTMLIEVGGQYNNIREVNNTLKVLAKLLSEFIRDEENG